MPQFFVSPKCLREEGFFLEGPEAYHLAKVLRYQKGQELELFDGQGGRYRGKITELHPDGKIEGSILSVISAPKPHSSVRLELYPALLKASHWEWLLEKGTEIGLHAFHPVVTQRTVVLLHEAERVQSKGDRWGKIILSAAKQCDRSDLPAIASPMPLRDALAQAQERGLVLFGWEGMAGSPARAVLHEAISKERAKGKHPMSVSLFTGPEGGFAPEEVELAEAHDAVLFGMGATVMRAETAAVAAMSLILYELGVL